MLRKVLTVAMCTAAAWMANQAAWGQVGNTNQGRTAGASLGGTTQGGRLSQSNIGASNSSVALSSRFQTDSSRFTSGTQALGQTTAGLGAVQGVMGGGQFGSFGSSGFGGRGLTNSLFGLSAMRGMGGRGMGGGGLGQQGANQQQGSQQIRTRLVIAFPNPLGQGSNPQVRAIRSKAMARLVRSLQRAIPESADRVQVQLDGATAVLRGSVGSDHQKKIAELLVKMEPGIADVRNELNVDRRGPTQ